MPVNSDAPAIETISLTKKYGSSPVNAVDSLNMIVHPGEIFGFLGPNGSGKTTTIKLLLDLIRPTSGSARMLGMDCNESSLKIRDRIGYLPGELKLYSNTPGDKIIKLFASLRSTEVSQAYVKYLCQQLDANIDGPVGKLSQGNRQKVGLILALMSKPDILILDEPTTGLDPIAKHKVLGLLTEAQSEGRTVFFSSHALPDVEQICDRVGIIRTGRLQAVEQVQDLRSKKVHRIRINFSEPISLDVFNSLSGVRSLPSEGNSVYLEVAGDLDAVIKVASQYMVESVQSEQPSLEEVFMSYYEDSSTDRTDTDGLHA